MKDIRRVKRIIYKNIRKVDGVVWKRENNNVLKNFNKKYLPF